MIDCITGAKKDDKKVVFMDGFITVIRRDITKYSNFDNLRKELKTAEDSDIFTVLELEQSYQIIADVDHDNASLTLDDIAQIWPDVYLVIYESALDGDIYKRERNMEGSYYWKRISTTAGFFGG